MTYFVAVSLRFWLIVTDTVGKVEVLYLRNVILLWPSRDRLEICCARLIDAEFWNLLKKKEQLNFWLF